MSSKISRRKFLKQSAIVAAGLTIAPNTILGKTHGHVAPSDKLNILGVGIGGRGAADLKELESQNIIGLCDVDWKYAEHVFNAYPKAKRFNDYRKMYDEMLKEADAVMVATADHTHAIIAADAITAGKNVYVEKPLTLAVYESRLLEKLAKHYKVATQMGNQGASLDTTRKVIEWIWNGEIGEVRKVEAFTDRPIWPQGIARPEGEVAIPSTMNWDAFIGPAQYRPYNPIYTPWNFRGWWDFGTGALGDMANHILQVAFKGLKLGAPIKIQGSSTSLLTDSCPSAEYIKYVFPARENMPKVAMPEVELTWYDGGLRPLRPVGLPDGKELNVNGGCVIFYGSKDTLICGCYGTSPYLVSGRVPDAPKVLREVTTSHQMDWVRACKESPAVRVPSASDFAESGPLNEMVVMGVLAVRLQSLNQELAWDGENMKFTNIPATATIRTMIKDGFEIHDGHPTFDKTFTDPVNAIEYANKLIKPVYRDGWKLPDMPVD
jgi:hypothetical protein